MKKWIILGMAGMLVILTVGCGAASEQTVSNESSDGTVEEQSVEATSEIETTEATTQEMTQSETQSETQEQTQTTELELSETGQMAYDFVKAIQTEDYETAYAMLDSYDTDFMDESTFEWVVERGDFADIIATDDEITEVDCRTDDGSYFYYLVTVGTKTFEISAFTNDDDEWEISYFAADATMMVYWRIGVPVGMTVSVDGFLVPEKYLWGEGDGMNFYMIESIPIMEHTIVVTSPEYGDYEITLTPEKDEDDIMGRAYPIAIIYDKDDGWKAEVMDETGSWVVY